MLILIEKKFENLFKTWNHLSLILVVIGYFLKRQVWFAFRKHRFIFNFENSKDLGSFWSNGMIGLEIAIDKFWMRWSLTITFFAFLIYLLPDYLCRMFFLKNLI